jgi:beta-lactamase class A
MHPLKSQLETIIAASGATAMGVAIKHLESGEELYLDANRPFPLCSVVKIPVLCEAFHQLRAGKFSLDDRWELTLAEKNLPSGVLVFFQDGLLPTVRDLLTLMIIISDNTATDMVMHRLGTAAINDYMHGLGLANTHIVMTIREIFEDILPSADPHQVLENLDRPPDDIDKERRTGRAYSLGSDNNVGTARDMNHLLELIWHGEIVDRETCDQMLHILLQQQLDTRLPRFLPPGTPIAHKTGTLAGIRNDSGIIYCNDHSHVAVTVYSTWDAEAVKGDRVVSWERMTAIDSAFGHIGRAVYDHYTP